MMGAGLLTFYALATSSMPASVSIPVVDTAMLIVSALGAIVTFSEPFGDRPAAHEGSAGGSRHSGVPNAGISFEVSGGVLRRRSVLAF